MAWPRHHRLDVVNKFVTNETDGAAGKSRQTRNRDGAVAAHDLFDDLESVAHRPRRRRSSRSRHDKFFPHFAVLDNLDGVASLFDQGAWIAADKRIAADVFASLDGLEQKRFTLSANFLIGGKRRFEVGQDGARDRDQVAPLRQSGKLSLGRIEHGGADLTDSTPDSPQGKRGVKQHDDRVTYNSDSDGDRHQEFAKTNQGRTHRAHQRGLADETQKIKREVRLLELLEIPRAITVFTEAAHQPGPLQIARRHQQAGRADDNCSQRPQGKGEGQNQIDQTSKPPPQFARNRVPFQNQVRRRQPGAEQIHPAREKQQSKKQEIFATAKWNGVLHRQSAILASVILNASPGVTDRKKQDL